MTDEDQNLTQKKEDLARLANKKQAGQMFINRQKETVLRPL